MLDISKVEQYWNEWESGQVNETQKDRSDVRRSRSSYREMESGLDASLALVMDKSEMETCKKPQEKEKPKGRDRELEPAVEFYQDKYECC